MRKTAVATLILISMMTSGVVCIQPIKAEYQSSITINADGSVTPSTAPIQQTGNIYAFTSDVIGNITVNRGNIILEGNGHTISGGFSLQGLSCVTIKNFIITDTRIGIQLTDTSHVEVVNNTITKTTGDFISFLFGWEVPYAVKILGGHSNMVLGNNLIDNYEGIYLGSTDNNLIVANNIVNTVNPLHPRVYSYGLIVHRSANNSIYHNNFINNSVQVNTDFQGNFDSNDPYPNAWDNGDSNGGNYWSDYWNRLTYYQQTHPGAEWVYPINKSNRDTHPLMEPFNTTTYLLEIPPPKIIPLSSLHQTYNETSVPLVFTTDKAVVWMGYSLDGKQNVTITGNSTITGIPNGSHSLIVYANDTFGKMGVSETVAFTMAAPELFSTLLVAAGIGVAVLVVGVCLFWHFKKRVSRVSDGGLV